MESTDYLLETRPSAREKRRQAPHQGSPKSVLGKSWNWVIWNWKGKVGKLEFGDWKRGPIPTFIAEGIPGMPGNY